MRLFLMICFIGVATVSSKAQISTSFSFGSLGTENASASIFTGPVVMEGNTECLKLKNGINLMVKGTSNGAFKMGCKINGVKEDIKYTVFPNPSNDYLIIKTDQDYLLDPMIDLNLQDIRGTVVFGTELTPVQLKQGYRINTASLANGLYLIKIVTGKETRTYKLIKTGNLR